MPASNIPSVTLNKDGSVTIVIKFTDIGAHKIDLLHVWLAGTGNPAVNGTGLAIDCLEEGATSVDVDGDTETFTISDVKGANGAEFGEGPATVSAIGVLVPKSDPPPNPNEPVAEVIQWGRTLTLVTGEPR